nr:hypothetical protein [Tanacetum cinerariifolium]
MVNWIMTYISSVAFAIDTNKERHVYFRSRWWLRQGDPASLYWFTLVMKILSLMLAREVDDGDVKSIQVIKEALLEFSGACRLNLNMVKSVFFFRSVKEPKKLKILEVIPFDEGKFPVKYLGIPLLAKRLRIKEYEQLVDQVKGKIQEWKNKAFSYAGSNTNNKGKSKVVWKIVCKPKDKGGLGIKQLGEWNEVLLTKHIYNIVSKKDSLWVKWVNLVKLKEKRFWEINEEKTDSCTWRTLLDLRERVRPFIWYRIGNGRNTSMWNDN